MHLAGLARTAASGSASMSSTASHTHSLLSSLELGEGMLYMACQQEQRVCLISSKHMLNTSS